MNDKVVTRDGARLVTQTVFPASAPFPPTGKTKLATMYVQTPYDADLDPTFIKAQSLLSESAGYSLAVTLQIRHRAWRLRLEVELDSSCVVGVRLRASGPERKATVYCVLVSRTQ